MIYTGYNIGFDTDFNSTNKLTLEVLGGNAIFINYGKHPYSIDSALKRLERWIRIIPHLRFKKTIKKVKSKIEEKYVHSFEELLEKECEKWGKKETDFYTEEE